MASASDPYAVPGALIAGKYRVERVLGMGGMGVVVAAIHVALGHRVAIKTLRVTPRRDDAVARFEREAMVAASLASEHTARVFDLGTLPDGSPFMVMEYLEGTDLRRLVGERGPLRVEDAVLFVAQACEAVGLAHAQGIVHRDLTPSNLFLARRASGTSLVKVLDFGIAQIGPDPSRRALTATGVFLGCPLYSSPEQLRSARSATPRSDVWSLGAVLYELLSGIPPFSGKTIPEMCAQVMLAEPTPLRTLRPEVPARVAAIVETCLRKKPEGRFPDATALGQALHGARREIVLGSMDTVRAVAPPSSASGRAALSDAPVAFPAESGAAPTAPVARRGKAIGVGVSTAALGAVLALAFWMGSTARPPSFAGAGPTLSVPPLDAPRALPMSSTAVVTEALAPGVAAEAGVTGGEALDAGADPHAPASIDSTSARSARSSEVPAIDRHPDAALDAPTPATRAAPSADAWPWGERK